MNHGSKVKRHNERIAWYFKFTKTVVGIKCSVQKDKQDMGTAIAYSLLTLELGYIAKKSSGNITKHQWGGPRNFNFTQLVS